LLLWTAEKLNNKAVSTYKTPLVRSIDMSAGGSADAHEAIRCSKTCSDNHASQVPKQ